MSRILSGVLGGLATYSAAAAQSGILAIVPLAGTIRPVDTPWAGSGRLWAAAAVLAVATGLAFFRRSRPFAALLGAAVLGFFLDLGLSGWLWRVEKITLLRDLGGSELEKQIRWGGSVPWLIAAPIFVLAFTIATFYHRAPHFDPEAKDPAGN